MPRLKLTPTQGRVPPVASRRTAWPSDASCDLSLIHISYLGVVLLLLPLMVLTGMTMSPGLDATFPWLLDLFGGRQSARSIHFITANLIVLF